MNHTLEELSTPPEPKELKEKAFSEANSPEWSLIEKESVYNIYILSSKGLPKYLWNHWKPWLKSSGFNWPVFLKVISSPSCEHDIHEWIEGKKSWTELIENTITPAVKGIMQKYSYRPP